MKLAVRRNDVHGEYLEEWYCEPPPAGSGYRVIREEWLLDAAPFPVRMIHEVELLP